MSKLTKEETLAINDPISNLNSKFALTTIDNPYDPFIQYRDWLLFDEEAGYCSNQYLARIARISSALSENEINEEIERAIDEIISLDFTKKYKKAINKNYKEEEED